MLPTRLLAASPLSAWPQLSPLGAGLAPALFTSAIIRAIPPLGNMTYWMMAIAGRREVGEL